MADFPKGWWGTDLGRWRPCSSTYELYPYESLPTLDESLFRGEFQWLRPDGLTGADVDPFDDQRDHPPAGDASALAAAATTLGVAVPAPLLTFMERLDLQRLVPSCTACEWDFYAEPVPNPVEDGSYLIRFLRDQQDVLFWYLNVSPAGSSVLSSPIPFDELDMSSRADEVLANTWWSAPHFEHFVYRFWIENMIWFGLEGDSPERRDQAAEQAYLAHYEAAR